MKGNLTGIAEGILFALNILLIFLLLFENYIEIPLWLQPLGRMHPLILHFPIALLFLAMVLEFFRFRTAYRSQTFFQVFISHLFLIAVITAAIAALMGLFLSLEEGYAGETLALHKWSGAGLVFLSSLMYGIRNKSWYQARISRVAAVATGFTLILAGHYGAALTHGEDFIIGPILQARTVNVPIEEAVVFEHVVMPVLEKKCNSCHNEGKAKGELILNNMASMEKGGKSGALFEPGNPENSLLMEKIWLPLEDEEHMPPSGKPQLTEEEKLLLQHWIKGKADFEVKVTALPPNDTLRFIATNLLSPAGNDENYDFSAADPALLKRLNNEYRVIRPLAKDSPALDVVLFNKDAYTANSIQELLDIKDQIVSLNVSKMPLADEDLKVIGQFPNLQRLNLNFTGVTAQGLVELVKLKKLRHLSLAGTPLEYTALKKQVDGLKSLASLTVWNTPIKEDEIKQLQNDYQQIDFIKGSGSNDNRIKLNIPMLKNKSNIFQDSIQLQLGHPIQDVEIRYTTDGSEPDSIHSPVFLAGKTVVKESLEIKAKAYKEGWYGSETVTINLYQNKLLPDTVHLLSKLNRVHPANGAQTFFDRELGGFNANSPAWANNWAGFSSEDMELLLEYENPVKVSSLSLNTLVEPETIIFPPDQIEVWGGDSENDLRLMGKMNPDQPQEEKKPYIQLINFKLNPFTARYIKVVAKPVRQIPSWHRSKGRSALLLVDEMFVN